MTRIDKQNLRVNKAINNIKQIQYLSNAELISESLNEWCEAKPDNEHLTDVRTAWINILFYINSIELNEHSYGAAYNELMERKNKEILELRELVGKISEDNMERDDSIVR
jgi:hypothetical protein